MKSSDETPAVVLRLRDMLKRDRRLGHGGRRPSFPAREPRFQDAYGKIARRLDSIGVPYAVAGGMALYAHGFRRLTDDVDILVTREGLNRSTRSSKGFG